MNQLAAALGALRFGVRRRLPIIHQSEISECGLACLAMVAQYHGAHFDMLELRRRFSVSLKGLPLAGMVRAANAIHLAARPVRLEMGGLTQLKLPCVLHWNFNHYVVLEKIRGRRLTIHDPALGIRTVTLEEASRCFTGFALELWPNEGFAPIKKTQRIPLSLILGKVVGWSTPVVTVLLLAVVLEITALLSPLFMQFVLDEVIPAHDQPLLLLLAVAFGLLYLTQNLISMMRSTVLLRMSTLFSVQVRSNLFHHLLQLPLSFFIKRSLGDVASRFASIDVIQRTVTTSFIEGVLDGLMALATLVLMLMYSPKLAVVSIAALAVYIAGRLLWYRPLHSATEEQIINAARQNSHFLESVRGVRAIKLFGRSERRHSGWLNLVVRQVNSDLRTQYLHLLYGGANSVIFSIENILIVYMGASAVLAGELSAGVLLTFMAYKSQFGSRVTALVNKYFDLKMLSLQMDRVSDFIVEKPEAAPVDDLNEEAQAPLEPSLELRGLAFRYGEHEKFIFTDVNLQVAAGEFVALAGPSGCGKSTLMQVMLGVYPPTRGTVLIGGVDATSIGRQQLRRMIGTVMQDDELFAGTIAENISFFDDDVDLDWVRECARMAAVEQEISSMSMGFHTFIGDMGSVLSGGQKQRILLARALYKRPSLLLLDEATSHLDVYKEKQVNEAISALNITRIIIAHRPDTLASADRVIPFASLMPAAERPATLRPVAA
ncbi:peptidase domain-containing ABC transporter [Pseudoduganella chitinolytica]|uniref:Peptidase domain-containing ABC transporter n=1 Tax=Pseudoduganella chitinolytica TaxID=34070 RepID=A0ABY8B703_9BURK|nr:peptidase domain-containing ABC transporter [Pseudoduganella chitinolytica]WEF30778.1 peptidase domain-containing ABC transporter [Pseudoduganella chitinolytica]